jgi:hypothetical protein
MDNYQPLAPQAMDALMAKSYTSDEPVRYYSAGSLRSQETPVMNGVQIHIQHRTSYGTTYFKVVAPVGPPGDYDRQQSMEALAAHNLNMLMRTKTLSPAQFDAIIGLGFQTICAHCEHRMRELQVCEGED